MSNANESGEDTRNAELFDPDDPEYQKQLWRPPDIEQDVKEMERRKRVEIIMNSLAEEFDNELLISLVHARPVLWNKYSDKCHSDIRNAWSEVSSLLVGEFESMTEATQNAIRQAITRRWNNIRSAYVKYEKKVQNAKKSGEEGSKIKPYLYHDHLKFLSNQTRETSENIESILGLPVCRETSDNMEPTVELHIGETSGSAERNFADETSDNEELNLPKITSIKSVHPFTSRKRQKPMGQETSNESLMAFFESIMPHLIKFDDNEVLEFKMGVLQVIKGVSDRKNRGLPPPCCPQYYILPSNIPPNSIPIPSNNIPIPSTSRNIRYLPPTAAPATHNQFISSTSATASYPSNIPPSSKTIPSTSKNIRYFSTTPPPATHSQSISSTSTNAS